MPAPTDSGLGWTPVARAPEAKYDVVMPDARGDGQTDAPDTGYDHATRAADLHVGTTPELLPRVARLRKAPGGVMNVDQWNRDDLRQAIVPAAGGQFHARSLARMYAALVKGGELNGTRLVSPERSDEMRTRQTRPGHGAKIGTSFGLGYRLGSPVYAEHAILRAMGPDPRVFGHTGAGGAIGFADPERRFSFGLTKNLLHPGVVDGRVSITRTIIETVRRAFGVAQPE